MFQFPPEVIANVFFFLSPFTLRRLYLSDVLPQDLRLKIEKILYRKVTFGRVLSQDMHNVTIEELEKMARGEIRAKTVYLKFNLVPCQYKYGWQKLFSFCRRYSRFLASIDRIDFEGTYEIYEKCFTNPQNVVEVNFIGLRSLQTNQIPASCKSLEIDLETESNPFLLAWPQTLETMKWRNANASFAYFPPHLKELCVENPMAVWLDYPKNLVKLSLTQGAYPDGIRYPKNLSTLELMDCGIRDLDFLSKVPNVRTLNLQQNKISLLSKWELPENLEELVLVGNYIRSLENVVFPVTLKRLNLTNNFIANLAGVKFPDLELLYVSNFEDYSTVELKNVTLDHFPESLHTLFAVGQTKMDWSFLGERENLRKLYVDIDKAPIVNFPPNLTTLLIKYRDQSHKHADVNFPKTLTSLTIDGGTPSTEAWDLPNVRECYFYGILGPIKVPATVEKLTLQTQVPAYIENAELPYGLESMICLYPIRRYPESLVSLSIQKFAARVNKSFPASLLEIKLADCPESDFKRINLNGVEYVSASAWNIEKHMPQSVRWLAAPHYHNDCENLT